MDVRRPNPLFSKGIDPDALWGPGNHTFLSGDRGIRGRGPVQKIKTDSVDLEVAGFQVFGEIVVGDKVPVVEIIELSYSGVPEQPYIVEYSINGGPTKSRMTSELVSPEVIRENPDLLFIFCGLQEQLEQFGQHKLSSEVGKLIRQAKP